MEIIDKYSVKKILFGARKVKQDICDAKNIGISV